jgi:hypothetical protein
MNIQPVMGDEPIKAWKHPTTPVPFLWFEGNNGDRYLVPPNRVHGHLDAKHHTLTLYCGKDTITVQGPAIADLVEAMGSGRAQGIRANGTDLTSVVITREVDAVAAAVLQAMDA